MFGMRKVRKCIELAKISLFCLLYRYSRNGVPGFSLSREKSPFCTVVVAELALRCLGVLQSLHGRVRECFGQVFAALDQQVTGWKLKKDWRLVELILGTPWDYLEPSTRCMAGLCTCRICFRWYPGVTGRKLAPQLTDLTGSGGSECLRFLKSCRIVRSNRLRACSRHRHYNNMKAQVNTTHAIATPLKC
uniref:Uncharacterized protein n=1 Tax=Ananas comosus var. bracteatus TaxID=296719 RepID=A0A6V7NEZ9_ANACO|nr:unnamed protein product [Ananas comosus var. bracteatus]